MPLEWKWTSDDENIKYYRYQLNGEDENNWTVVGGETTSVTLDSDSLAVDFFLQSSYDGLLWSDSSVGTYYPTSVKEEDNDIGLVSLSWNNRDDYTYLRYQRDSEIEDNWTVIDGGEESIVLPYHEGLNTYYIQSSFDGVNWSESASSTYTYEKKSVEIPLSLRVNLAPYSAAVYYFYNGHYIDNAKTLMGTVYGTSESIELDWTPFSFLRIYPEAGYAYEMKIQTVIPKRQDMHYIKLGGGVDFLIPLTEKSDIYLGALGGAMWHVNNSKYSIAPYFGARLGLDVSVSSHLTLGSYMRVCASFLNTSEYLYNSVTLLIDPLSLSLSYVF